MAATPCVPRTRLRAAKLVLGVFSVAPVAYGYARSLRPSEHGFSRLPCTIATGSDL